MEVKGLQKPDDDGGHEDYRESPLEEVFCLVPEEPSHVLGPGEPVVGQLHDKGHRFAPEGRPFHQESHQDPQRDSQHIQPNHHQSAPPREEGGCEKAVDGELGRAAHEGRQQDCHLPVPLRGQRPRGHDPRHRAAEANQHGHDAAARETNLAQQLVHDEGHSGDITAVLQKREEEEQGHDDGKEAQDASHAIENTVYDQRLEHFIHIGPFQGSICQPGQEIHRQGHQLLEPCADYVKGQPEHDSHDAQKSGDGCIFSRQYLVNFCAPGVFFALSGLHYRGPADLPDEGEAHIGNGCRPIHAAFRLHLADDVLQHLLLVLIQSQGLQDAGISLGELAGGEAHGNIRSFRVILNQMHDGVKTAV